MPGGLLNLVSEGTQNVFLTGNPQKTFFKTTYKKYTNFGLQRLRIDYSGQRYLNLEQDSIFTFKVPRYAELLLDTYVVINLPDIWSPIDGFQDEQQNQNDIDPKTYKGVPYEFQWIDNLGIQLLKEIEITSGGATLQKFSGSYLNALKERDYSEVKKNLYDKMTGNVKELNDPANAPNNLGNYPNAIYWGPDDPAEPSIRGRKLYIPIDSWFTLSSKMGFPLVSMQYNELNITIRFRPVKELFTIRDVTDSPNNYPRVQPNFNIAKHQFYRFIQPPVNDTNDLTDGDQNTEWDTDIHLMATYAFLSDDETKVFAAKEQKYLIKEVHEYKFDNITGSRKVKLDTLGMVANWMYFFQRSDISTRNEWSNFSNWEFKNKPYGIFSMLPDTENPLDKLVFHEYPSFKNGNTLIDNTTTLYENNVLFNNNKINQPGCECDYFTKKLYNTGVMKIDNQKEILQDLGILFDGQYREENLDAGVYNYMDKYVKTAGNASDGLYCYNFGLNTDPFELQPSGAVNMSKFNKIELEINTFEPPRKTGDEMAVVNICDEAGDVIGVRKPVWDIYKYNYDLTILEERYNILHFISGNCSLMWAR